MRVGLIGGAVIAHSRSPRMHNAAFAALGMDIVYELWPTEPEGLVEKVNLLRQEEVVGSNVTVPHKEAVLQLVDQVSETARRIGSVNTLIPRGDILIGDNTDAYGYGASIRESYPEFAPQRAIVLGAGGASRSVVVALQDMGASEVVIVNRTYARAKALATELSASAAEWSMLPELLPTANLVTNATALGWHDERVIDADLVALLPEDALVTDLTYANTLIMQDAAARDLRTLDGLGMLIHQGVRAFELWFDVTPPVDVMRAAAIGE
ncbi:MAG: shikimate dehydrogenase [Thermomicrobiales bacterium]|nr:shikimate dehydrogenase [Thermomicrobiales bacterium]